MSNGIGKRSSKWDLASESCHQDDTGVSNSEVDNRSNLYHDKKSKSTWPSSRSGWDHDRRSSHVESFHSTDVKGDRWDNKNVKRSGRAYRENTSPPSRMRGREDDYAVSMSPGLESWRESHRDRSRSPRNKWSSRSCRSRSRSRSKSYNRSKSRSRSRSPVHNFKREHERWKDRSENGSRGTIKPCKDFVSGRCKMGIQCQFLHDQYDGGKKHYSAILSGNREESRPERRYSSGYSQPNSEPLEDAMDRSGGKSTQFCQRYERGSCHRGSSCNFVHRNSHDIFDGVRNIRHGRHERENRGISAIPCKFFASSGCFNGDYCKFSHSLPGRLNTDRRLPEAQDVHHRRHDSRSRDDFSVVVDANSKPVPAFESRSEGKKNNDIPVKSASSDSLQWPVQNGSADCTAELSMDGESRHALRTDTIQISAHHMPTTNAYSAEHLPVTNVVSSEHFPLPNDEWRLRAFEKSPDHLPEAILDSQGQISLLDAPAIQCSDSHEVVQQTVHKPEGNSNFSVDAPSSSNVQIFSVQNLGDNLDERNIQSYKMAPSAPSLVTIEELPRATETPALGQVLGNGANLAMLYATLEALQPHPLANHVGSLDLRSACHSNQYDPLSDSLVQANVGASSQPPISLLSITDEKCPVVEESQNHAKGYEPLALNKGLNDKEGVDAPGQVEANEEKVFVQSKETAEIEVNKMNKENDTDASDDKAAGEDAKEEEKKSKSAKVDRMFKFSLAALVKEILKPTWREGQLSREAHKTIVKKVVDKITSSVRGSNIFQTQETIDSYLSHSKEKVSKLIQAYVEKYKTT